MNIELSPTARLFIIEGIAGAGKNTFQKQLEEKLADKIVYDYTEEELLFSWKHCWIKNINEMRLTFYENFLDYCTKILSEEKNAVFILNRFHISYAILSLSSNAEQDARYQGIVEKLKKMEAFIFVPIVDEQLIENRSAHKERICPIWTLHRQKRLKQGGFTTFQEMYSQEQKKIITLIEKQGVPYNLVKVDLKR